MRLPEQYRKGVILCACHGCIADRLLFDEISDFLHEMAPDIPVIVGDNLCQPNVLRHIIVDEGLQSVVVGACSRIRPKVYFWENTDSVSLNPHCTRVVDILKEAEMSHDDLQISERAKLLLFAQLHRMDKFNEVGQSNLKLCVSTPRDKVTRREFLESILPQYEIIPFIDSSRCFGGDKYSLCQNICPLNAILIDEGVVTIDKSVCSGCGACIIACPYNAISYPLFSFEEIDNELEGLLFSGKPNLEQRVIALTCQRCSSGKENDIQNKLKYPLNVLPVEIPCLAMASPWLMLRVFDHGAQGLALICSGDKCHIGFNPDVWQDNIRFVQSVLNCWDIEPNRIRLFELREDNQLVVENEIAKFASEIKSLGPTQFNVADRIDVSGDDGFKLSVLIQNMGNKLVPPLKGDISAGAVPFGKLSLDVTKCTGCGICALNCPANALTTLVSDDGNYQLLFKQDSCVACGICTSVCPEGCIQLEHILELDSLGDEASMLFEDDIVRCRKCGKPVAPRSMIRELAVKLKDTGRDFVGYFDLCPACKMDLYHHELTGVEDKLQVNPVDKNLGSELIK